MNNISAFIYTDGKIDLLHSSMQADPHPMYQHLRNNNPVCELQQNGVWAISRYHDVVTALRTPEIFSSTGVSDTFAPDWLPGTNERRDYVIGGEDKPEHTLHRKLVGKNFTHSAIESMKSDMRKTAETLIAEIDKNKILEFIDAVAYPYVEGNMYRFLGVNNNEMYPGFRQWSRMIDTPPLTYSATYEEQIDCYNLEIFEYCQKLLESRKKTRGNDFISRFLGADENNTVLSFKQKAEFIEILFRGSGLPVALLLTHAIFRLSQDQELFELLKAEPEKIRLFIDELLRFDSPAPILPRRTLSAVTLSNVLIPKNTQVFLLLGAANRDPEQFNHAETFDIFRPNNNTHVSLGYGMHRCLGETLVRAEMTVFLEVLLSRFSTITCPPSDQLDWYYRITSHSVTQLPTRFS